MFTEVLTSVLCNHQSLRFSQCYNETDLKPHLDLAWGESDFRRGLLSFLGIRELGLSGISLKIALPMRPRLTSFHKAPNRCCCICVIKTLVRFARGIGCASPGAGSEAAMDLRFLPLRSVGEPLEGGRESAPDGALKFECRDACD